jgi:hypothetical protein
MERSKKQTNKAMQEEEIWIVVESQPTLECSNWGRLRKVHREEVWVEIPGYPGYQCSNFGNVKSNKIQRSSVKNPHKGRIRSFAQGGAEKVSLSRDGKKSNFYVSRLTAICFVPNVLGLRYVNHIDGNNKNNHATNLVWSERP